MTRTSPPSPKRRPGAHASTLRRLLVLPMLRVLCALSSIALMACGGDGAPVAEGAIACGGAALYNATDEAHLVVPDPAERLALSRLHMDDAPEFFCTGVFIDARWVLTAAHCIGDGEVILLVGLERADGGLELVAPEVVVHPELDLALVGVGDSDPLRAVGGRPIAPLTDAPSEALLNTPAQLAGYGATQHGDKGALRFAVETMVEIDDRSLTVDGMGDSGACDGDSGGPLLARTADGTLRTLGVLSVGSASCLGIDRYVRLDIAQDWIAQQLGATPQPVDPRACGGIDGEGMCRAGSAIHCDDGALRAVACDGAMRCGWDAAAVGYRCIDAGAADPCDGVDDLGRCEQGEARRCDHGQLRVRTCGDGCEGICGRSPVDGVAGCR